MAEHEREPREDQGFLRRWSRRKADARRVERDDVAHAEPQPEAAPEPARPGPTEAIDPETLPDIDSLTAASDFRVFMRAGVPAELRRLALRKLWRLDPALANLDGLLEYGEDYTQVGRGGMDVKTAYQVGKGFLKKIEDAAEVTPEEARTAATRIDTEAPAPSPQIPAEAEPVQPATEGPNQDAAEDPERQAQAPRRRPLPRRG